MTTLANTVSTRDDNRITIGSVLKAAAIVATIAIVSAFVVVNSSEGRFAPTIAKDLMQQSATLSTAGDREAALEASRKAVKMNRHLVRVSPIFYQPRLRAALAASLYELSVRLGEAGDTEGARIAEHEAATLRGQLGSEAPKQAASL
jgi:hypothetical protein